MSLDLSSGSRGGRRERPSPDDPAASASIPADHFRASDSDDDLGAPAVDPSGLQLVVPHASTLGKRFVFVCIAEGRRLVTFPTKKAQPRLWSVAKRVTNLSYQDEEMDVVTESHSASVPTGDYVVHFRRSRVSRRVVLVISSAELLEHKTNKVGLRLCYDLIRTIWKLDLNLRKVAECREALRETMFKLNDDRFDLSFYPLKVKERDVAGLRLESLQDLIPFMDLDRIQLPDPRPDLLEDDELIYASPSPAATMSPFAGTLRGGTLRGGTLRGQKSLSLRGQGVARKLDLDQVEDPMELADVDEEAFGGMMHQAAVEDARRRKRGRFATCRSILLFFIVLGVLLLLALILALLISNLYVSSDSTS